MQVGEWVTRYHLGQGHTKLMRAALPRSERFENGLQLAIRDRPGSLDQRVR